MKKLLLFFVVVLLTTNVLAQTMYVAAKDGLSLREKPDINAKVLAKIPYGQKVSPIILTPGDPETEQPAPTVVTEGFTSNWQKVKYNNKTGYVPDTYLFLVPPPKKGIKSLENYFKQLSTLAGRSYVKNEGDPGLFGAGGEEFTKMLYKNGMEVHKYLAYEYDSQAYLLPGFSIQRAFLLMRLLQEIPEFIANEDPFPTESTTTQLKDGGKKIITVEKESYGDQPFFKKITFVSDEAEFVELSIYMMDGQVVISRSAGV